MHEIPTPRLRRVFSDGDCAVNLWLTSPSTVSAEALCYLDWDSIVIDAQHTSIDVRDAIGLLTAIAASGTDATPLIRLNWNEPPTIMKLLDAGAMGVICPGIKSRAEIEDVIGACRYPPAGYRSFGPFRAGLPSPDAYYRRANDSVLVIAQIETADAYESLDEVLSTPGLDGVYIGSRDLALSIGLDKPMINHRDPDAVTMTRTVLDAARRHGVPVGMHVPDAADLAEVTSWGPSMITPGTDATVLAEAMRAAHANTREAVSGAGSVG